MSDGYVTQLSDSAYVQQVLKAKIVTRDVVMGTSDSIVKILAGN